MEEFFLLIGSLAHSAEPVKGSLRRATNARP